MEEELKISILILAAGESKRMGDRIKQLLPWKHTTLLGNAIEQAKASMANETYVVLGAYNEIIRAEAGLNASKTIQNTHWKNGLGSSIATGMDYFLEKSLSCDAVLIMLTDQPLIDTNYLNKMMGYWIRDPSKIITTHYGNRSGVPAIFGKEHYTELQKLSKDFGAKDIIASHADKILVLDSGGKEIDIDSWETYEELVNKHKS